MSRSGSKQRLVSALPVVAIFLAGLTAARKRRTTRRNLPTPADRSFAPPDTSPTARGERSAADPAPAAAHRARGATAGAVVEALAKGDAMTAADVALVTGIPRATISSTLSRLTRTGKVTKAERGYKLSVADVSSPPAAAKQAPKRRAPSKPASARKPRTTVPHASAPRAAGATTSKVLAALTPDRGLTASEVATATGLGRGTVSTTLSRLAKAGTVVKADRGYRLPG
jgi:DNA-binding transcriptional ArsR family regulator